MVTFNEERQKLLEIIVDDYVKKIQIKSKKTIDKQKIQKQNIKILCGTTKDCNTCLNENGLEPTRNIQNPEEWSKKRKQLAENECKKECPPDYCLDCLKLYITPKVLQNKDKKENKEIINNIKENSCSSLCVCNINELNLDQVVIFNSKILNLEPDDIKDISNSIKTKYKNYVEENTKICKNGKCKSSNAKLPSEKQIKQIVTNISSETDTTIIQQVSAFQNVVFEGTGNIKGLHINMLKSAVMNAIVTNTDSLSEINNIVYESQSYIKEFVDEKLKSVLTRVWENNKNFFIYTFIGIGSLIFIIIFLNIYLAIK